MTEVQIPLDTPFCPISYIEPLCGETISKSLASRLCRNLDHDLAAWNNRDLSETPCPILLADALYVRVRSGHQVIKKALLTAVGADEKGDRHILGLSVAVNESESTWGKFFLRLNGSRPIGENEGSGRRP